MIADRVRELLAQPAPGCVRVMRVNNRSYTPRTWGALPWPDADHNNRAFQMFMRSNDVRAYEWHCAADAHTMRRWWPDEYLNDPQIGDVAVYEVPEEAAVDCGSQYVFIAAAARRIM